MLEALGELRTEMKAVVAARIIDGVAVARSMRAQCRSRVELLKANYSSQQEAAEKLPAALAEFYKQNYPDLYSKRSQDIQSAAHAILAIYSRNVFPELKVTWGTYPNNLGHTDFPGCFRCHDGSHSEAGGTAITQDCSACHELVAMDEASPEILKTLGVEERISRVQKK